MEHYDDQIPEQENREPRAQTETPVQPQPVYQEPVYQAPVYEQPVYEQPRPQKGSPFADSPYVMNHTYEPVNKPAGKKKGGAWKRALCAILVIALVAGSCVATAFVVNERWEDRLDAVTDRFEDKLEALEEQIESGGSGNVIIPGDTVISSEGSLTPAQVYAMNVDSVVMIFNKVTTTMYGQSTSATSTGSGFILTEDGYVVTNYHVVEGEGSITVETYDGVQHKAQLIGSDATNDVALLKIEAQGLQAVTLGSSDALMVGDQVVAIGNPLGELTATQTVGYISAKERDVTTDGFAINMLQTDAAINSGNSGGPLFNMRGEVVGITTAKYSGTSSSGASIEGVGFAIPIDDVSGMLSDLANYGYVTGAYLGVSVSDMDADAAAYYGMPVGAYVQEVVEGNCAHTAGVQVKDIIVEVGGYKVTNVNSLSRALRNFSAGDVTTITVYRGGQELTLSITLDEKPITTETETIPEGTYPEGMPEDGNFEDWYSYLEPFFGQGGQNGQG